MTERGRGEPVDHGGSGRRARGLRALLTAVVISGAAATTAAAEYTPGLPPKVDPARPTFAGQANPVPAEPSSPLPNHSTLERIFQADVAAGGTSYWFDRALERPFLSNNDSYLYTRGRALYMYTHQAGTLGFANGWAYRERPTGGNVAMYTVAISDATLAEVTAERKQYPSHWSSAHTATGLRVDQKKFITFNNVAVTLLNVTNTGAEPTARTVTIASPLATTSAAVGTELTGSVNARYGLTTITPRLSAAGFTVTGTTLTRSITLAPGESISIKVQFGATTAEIPEAATEYERYRDYDSDTAFKTHLREYNRWWVDNVPYIDIPNANVKKMSIYRTFLNRYNLFDGNIPGNDYQNPVSIEGVLGYNNAIQLTQPMHMQDLKYFRNPLYSYGNFVSSGETSKCSAFTDNPGNTANWNNTYEQYIAREGWNAYKVHGGNLGILRNFAKYAECDVKGQLSRYDQNNNFLVAYNSGALTGNDADAVALAYYNSASQERTETAFWYSGARAAAEAYTVLGEPAKADEMNAIADNIRNAILTLLWDDGPINDGPGEPTGPVTRVPGQFGNAVRLGGDGPAYATMPNGILNGINDFTISTWVNPAATSTWSRIFDFGTGTTANMFLTINGAGNGLRFAITTGGGGAEQQINRTPTGQLPLNQWSHVAVTLSGNTGTLYLNGQPVGTNANMTLRPSSLGNTTQNWIGRSQYGDPTLNGVVDDFQIYDRALSAAEIATLGTAPGQPGAGNVASYKFDEESGATLLDSSGNNRNANLAIATVRQTGKVFKMRDVARNALVPWKDQQNFSPFTEGVVPNTDNYKQALRFYADKAEFPIMPSYTANQFDKAEASAAGRGGTNNFSNINSTLQAQLYSKAMREYPSSYITADMYRNLLEWVSWNEYVNGDNRYPDNNEYFFNWNATTQTLGRSGIHHNILGAFNFMIIDDIVGLTPRLDGTVELWPIDIGYDHYLVDNLSYHGHDLSIVWDKPGDGTRHYGDTPEGMSVYIDGRRAFTTDDIAHVRWDSASGTVSVLDGSDTAVLYKTSSLLETAQGTSLTDNARIVDMFQRAGVDLTRETGSLPNLAQGKAASASFTTTTPTLQMTSPANAVDGFTISGLPATSGTYQARNPIWGTQGSPNEQDWLEVDLGRPTRFDTAKLYFYDNKQFGSGGNTYRTPAAYSLQYLNGSDWVDVPSQAKSPEVPKPNYNKVTFPAVTAQRMRVLVTRTGTLGVGIKELQLFDSASKVDVPGTVGGTVPPTLSLALGTPAAFGAFTPGVAQTYSASTTANVISTAGDAALSVADPSSNATGHLVNASFSLPQPLQVRATNAEHTNTAFGGVGSSASPRQLLGYTSPISNDPVAVQFRQAIGSTDPLRTGTYSKTLTFTLSTTSP